MILTDLQQKTINRFLEETTAYLNALVVNIDDMEELEGNAFVVGSKLACEDIDRIFLVLLLKQSLQGQAPDFMEKFSHVSNWDWTIDNQEKQKLTTLFDIVIRELTPNIPPKKT